MAPPRTGYFLPPGSTFAFTCASSLFSCAIVDLSLAISSRAAARSRLLRRSCPVSRAPAWPAPAEKLDIGLQASGTTLQGSRKLLAIIAGTADERLPAEAHASLIVLAAELQAMRTLIASIEKLNHRRASSGRTEQADTSLGIGLVGATAIARTSPTARHSLSCDMARIGRVIIRGLSDRRANRSSVRSLKRAIVIGRRIPGGRSLCRRRSSRGKSRKKHPGSNPSSCL